MVRMGPNRRMRRANNDAPYVPILDATLTDVVVRDTAVTETVSV